MKDLRDYSGPFDPSLRYQDFSKETLAKLLQDYAMALMILEGNWHSILREKYGDAATVELDIKQWIRTSPAYTRRLARTLNIRGDNVETIFKALQMDPAFSPSFFDIEWQVFDGHRVRDDDVPRTGTAHLWGDRQGVQSQGQVPAPQAASSKGTGRHCLQVGADDRTVNLREHPPENATGRLELPAFG
ncbi:MAG: hypothetical protein NTU41_05405 [Chloroflexi bacterium]|nr:hypothetical protein [Chloroflexota bacterium]